MKITKTIYIYAITIICFAFLVFIITYAILRKRSLDNNKEFTNAIVIDHYFNIRGVDHFSFRFVVDNEGYTGHGQCCGGDSFIVGDTVLVVYDRTNPSNNEYYRDYINSLRP